MKNNIVSIFCLGFFINAFGITMAMEVSESKSVATPPSLKYQILLRAMLTGQEAELQEIVEKSEDLKKVYSTLKTHTGLIIGMLDEDKKILYEKLLGLTDEKFNALIDLLKNIQKHKIAIYIKDIEELEELPEYPETYIYGKPRYFETFINSAIILSNAVIDLALKTEFASKYASKEQKDFYSGENTRLVAIDYTGTLQDRIFRYQIKYFLEPLKKASLVKQSDLESAYNNFMKIYGLKLS